MHSWRVLILPYMDHSDIYDQYDFSVPWNHPTNARLAGSIPPLYQFPGRTGGTETNYLAIVGPGSAFDLPSEQHTSLFEDKLPTLMIVENDDRKIHWMQPDDMPLQDALNGISTKGGLTSIYVEPAGVTVDGQVLQLEPPITQDNLRVLLEAPAVDRQPASTPPGAIEIEDGRLREQQ